jgi:hypothetical protein
VCGGGIKIRSRSALDIVEICEDVKSVLVRATVVVVTRRDGERAILQKKRNYKELRKL